MTPNVKLGTRSRGTSANSATSCTFATRGHTPHSRSAAMMMPPLRQDLTSFPNNCIQWPVSNLRDFRFFARVECQGRSLLDDPPRAARSTEQCVSPSLCNVYRLRSVQNPNAQGCPCQEVLQSYKSVVVFLTSQSMLCHQPHIGGFPVPAGASFFTASARLGVREFGSLSRITVLARTIS